MKQVHKKGPMMKSQKEAKATQSRAGALGAGLQGLLGRGWELHRGIQPGEASELNLSTALGQGPNNWPSKGA